MQQSGVTYKGIERTAPRGFDSLSHAIGYGSAATLPAVTVCLPGEAKLATDHIGFYEKYGFVYKENRPDTGGEDSRIYYKQL